MAQMRIVLQLCEVIDPGDIATYIRKDGFQALHKARAMGPDAVIARDKGLGTQGKRRGRISLRREVGTGTIRPRRREIRDLQR